MRMFDSNTEREWFINQLDEVFFRRSVALGALCLMDTHYHALVQMGPVSLDRALNGLHMSYTKHVNDERNREGSLFRSRPGTDRILDDSYLLQVVPYIHNNPVEAGMVNRASDWPWSTDPMYRGEAWEGPDLDSFKYPPHFQGENRLSVYRERINGPVEEPEGGEGYIGTREEWESIERRDESREDRFRDRRGRDSMKQIARTVIEDLEMTVEDLKQPGRTQPEAKLRQRAMVRMYEEGYGPKEIGDYFNREKATVNYAVRKLQ